jgi:FtsP/CotA-like multicopper oxidase with cupredoxin domain
MSITAPHSGRGLAASTLLAIFLCAALPGGDTAQADPEPGDFRALPEFVSENGVLNATLVAEPRSIEIDGVQLDTLTFNGEYGGPVLRVKPGDRMNIHLVNHIATPINLHFHGLHCSPKGRSDNIHGIVVKPGDSFDYRVDIPATQPTGLYWYHTHVHGLSEEEVNGGLSGALIVDGIEKAVPETANARHRLMVLKTFILDRPGDAAVQYVHGEVQSINGGVHARIDAQAGATEFWRLTNQSPNNYFHLSVAGFHFRIVALDGVPTRRDIDTDQLDIAPASRIEALVTMPAAGTYSLQSGLSPVGIGQDMQYSRELATVVVSGAPAAAPSSAASDSASDRLLATGFRICHFPVQRPGEALRTTDLRQARNVTPRLIRFTQLSDKDVFLINGKVYDHRRIDTRIPLGAVEEWTIRNDTQDMHLFHIHQVHFEVMSINGVAQPFDRLLDTVRVPEMGNVVVRIAFTDPGIVGRFVYHCHVLMHEDKGMMANIEVYDPRRPGDEKREAAEHALHG